MEVKILCFFDIMLAALILSYYLILCFGMKENKNDSKE